MRRNGKNRSEAVIIQSFIGETPWMGNFPGLSQTHKVKRIQSEQNYRIPMESLTCRVMCGNGFLTGTIRIIIKTVPILIHKALNPGFLKFKEEVLGLTSQTIIHQVTEWFTGLPEKMSLMGLGVPNQNDFLNTMKTEEEVKIEYHDNGNKISEEHFKDGVRNGVSKHWYDDGIKKSEHHYKDGELHGVSSQWYANGQKECECQHQYGEPIGIWKEWHEDGSRKYEERYKNGKLDGIASGWYDKSRGGKKNYEDRYKDGNLIRTVYF